MDFFYIKSCSRLKTYSLGRQKTTQLKTWVFASCNTVDKLPPPLLTRCRDIHFRPYAEQEFVEIPVEILDREEGVDGDVAMIIADAVYNRLKSTNIRECVRIARLIGNETYLAKLDKIIETFTKYAALCSGNREVGRQD